MSKIYQKEDYGSKYEPQSRIEAFKPVQAIDTSRAIQQQYTQQVENVQTLARAAARQSQLDQAALQQQEAQSRVPGQMLAGLMALSNTALRTYAEVNQVRERVKEQRGVIDGLLGDGRPEPTTEQTQAIMAQRAKEQVDGQVVTETVKELVAEPDAESEDLARQIQVESDRSPDRVIRANAARAKAGFPSFVQSYIDATPVDKRPQTHAEAQDFMREVARQFFNAYGLFEANLDVQYDVAQAMSGVIYNSAAALVKSTQKMQVEETQRAYTAEAVNVTSLDAGIDAETIWREGSAGSRAFGRGFPPGPSAQNNEFTIKTLLSGIILNRNDSLLEDLAEVNKIPGNDGTKLGVEYADLFEKARREIQASKLQQYQIQEQEENIAIQELQDGFFDGVIPVEEAIARAEEIGGEKGYQFIEMINSLGHSFDPEANTEVAALAAEGSLTPSVLESYKARLSPEQYMRWARSMPDDAKAEKENTQKLDKYINSLSMGLRSAMLKEINPTTLNSQVQAELTIRHQRLVGELREMLQAEVRVNPGLLNDPNALAATAEAKSKLLLSLPHYILDGNDSTVGPQFKAPLSVKNNQGQIVAPGDKQDFTKYAPKDIFRTRDRANVNLNDLFITPRQAIQDAIAIGSGQQPSQRSREIAQRLGMSTNAFVDTQLRNVNIDGIPAVLRGPDAPPEAARIINGDIKTQQDAMRLLQVKYRLPRSGAAYLVGNLQQESGLNGQRSWDDEGAPAGGIASWRAGRLRAIEQKFGKKIEQITDAEQLDYLVKDMQKNYPTQWRIFNNPNSSPQELRRASYQYWRWRDEGSRFGYAERLLRGPKPSPRSFRPASRRPQASGGPIGGNGQVSSITFDKDQPGIDVFFEDKKFRSPLGGLVKDISYDTRYGNYVVVEAKDPLSGQTVDVLMSHFDHGGIKVKVGDRIPAGYVVGRQGGLGTVQSQDGTIASIDFLAPAPRGSKDSTPYRDWQRLRKWVADQYRKR